MTRHLVFLLFISLSSFANSAYETALEVRARSYAAYQISQEIMTNVNRVEMERFRQNFYPNGEVPTVWNHIARDYMERVNNRANVHDPNLSLEELSENQAKLNEEFYHKRKLNPVQSLAEISDDEAILLRRHSSKPLLSSDPSKAIDLINEQRAKVRNYIDGVKKFSNQMVSEIVAGSPSRYGRNPVINEIYQRVQQSKPGQRFRTMVQNRLGGISGDIKALTVSNPENRLKLLDIITQGSADPAKNANPNFLKQTTQNIDIKKALDTLPKDMATREAFARYIIEYGSEGQLKSLKMHDAGTMFHLEKKDAFKLRCGR